MSTTTRQNTALELLGDDDSVSPLSGIKDKISKALDQTFHGLIEDINEEEQKEFDEFIKKLKSYRYYALFYHNVAKDIADYMAEDPIRQGVIIEFLFMFRLELENQGINKTLVLRLIRIYADYFSENESSLYNARSSKVLSDIAKTIDFEENLWYCDVILLSVALRSLKL